MSDSGPLRETVAPPGVQATPEFIARSRPSDLDYIPVGTASPARAMQARSAADVAAAEAEMEALRARTAAQGAAARRAAGTLPPAPTNAASRPAEP